MLSDSVLNDPEAGSCELGEQLRTELPSVRTSLTQRDLLQALRGKREEFPRDGRRPPGRHLHHRRSGRLTHFNRAAVEFSGRTPQLGTDQWCVSWKLYHSDGTPMAHDECPMAIALREGRVVRGAEAIAERPDGKRIWFTPYPTPMRDAEGKVVGGINMLLDITERKFAEQASARLAAIVASSDDAIISKISIASLPAGTRAPNGSSATRRTKSSGVL
jgi:PAS domain S-box-containing protein